MRASGLPRDCLAQEAERRGRVAAVREVAGKEVERFGVPQLLVFEECAHAPLYEHEFLFFFIVAD